MEIAIGVCGLACGICKHYKNECLGCIEENELEKICIIYDCARRHSVEYCLKCSNLPCNLLKVAKAYCPKLAKIKLETMINN